MNELNSSDFSSEEKVDLKSSLQMQLSELEMLESMFCNPGEIHLDDYSIIADMTDYINDKTKMLPSCLDYIIKLSIDSLNYELCVTLPLEYPFVEPDIFVRNNKQNREQQRKINSDLRDYISGLERGDICIYSAITWLQDKAPLYINLDTEPIIKKTNNANRSNDECARYWIYSHHIYSKTKRREILNLAGEYSLSGFCLPGKPGAICIEGSANDCNSWWMFIKAMSWKRIVCKFVENEKNEDVDKFRKFKKFEELAFHCEGNRGNHMSLGELLKYLEAHDCANMFKELFGLDGKSPQE